MKQKILVTLVFCILFTGFALSQDGPPKHSKEGKRPSAEEMVKREMKMLKQELDLTGTQETFVQKILEDSYKKMEENFKNGNKDRDEMEKIMKEKDNNLKSVLTDEQWTKYSELQYKMKDKFKQDEDRPSGPPDRH
jgi:Spy/CpxP family protein refolding chaperone